MPHEVFLRRLDCAAEEIRVSSGSHTLGRGPYLGCTDKRISRSHATLLVTDDGQVTLTSSHVNPCHVVTKQNEGKNSSVLKKDEKVVLKNGDEFGLSATTYRYEVAVVERCSPTLSIEDDEINDVEETSTNNLEMKEEKLVENSIEKTKTEEKKQDEVKEENMVAMDVSDQKEESRKKKRALPSWMSSLPASSSDNVTEAPKRKKTPKPTQNKDKASPQKDAEDTSKVSKLEQPKQDQANAISDSDEDYQKEARARESCQYGSKCYRKNPQHREEYSHPGDDDYVEIQEEEEDDKEECQYGTTCYRKNPQHLRQFKHTKTPQPQRKAKKKGKRGDGFRDAEDSELDDYDYDDPFLNDGSSDDYQPTDSDSESELSQSLDPDESDELKRTLKEGKKFVRRS